MLGGFFRKISGKPADSFEQVQQMVTRPLPIPGLEGPGKPIVFVAKRTKEGLWQIGAKYDLRKTTGSLDRMDEIFVKAMEKHAGKKFKSASELLLNFDNAFLMLRDLEESLLAAAGRSPSSEPSDHFMEAYRLLPRQFRESLDDIHFARMEKTSILSSPKDDSAGQGARPKPRRPAN